MNMEEIPTTFDKKEISLCRKNIAIAILLRGGMYSNKQNISLEILKNSCFLSEKSGYFLGLKHSLCSFSLNF